jgi:hypothetical protein
MTKVSDNPYAMMESMYNPATVARLQFEGHLHDSARNLERLFVAEEKQVPDYAREFIDECLGMPDGPFVDTESESPAI